MKKKFIGIIGCTGIIALTALIHSCKSSDLNNKKTPDSVERKASGRIILAIGDSNGVINGGWPAQLTARLKKDTVLNNSESGRAIGFDNRGKPEWNALKNIKAYLTWGLNQSHQKPIDEVVILLGTNDIKSCFENKQDRIQPNLIKLIAKIRYFNNADHAPPHITIVTPPPCGLNSSIPQNSPDEAQRVRLLVTQFRDVALQHQCAYVDIYHLIKPIFDSVTEDHVHLTEEGHGIVAEAITKTLNDWEAPEPPSNVSYNYDENTISWNSSKSSDVIGYEVISTDKIIAIVAGMQINLPYRMTDLTVRARDGYGNVSIAVRPYLYRENDPAEFVLNKQCLSKSAVLI
jgi:lysophospholipase L1-like esterase